MGGVGVRVSALHYPSQGPGLTFPLEQVTGRWRQRWKRRECRRLRRLPRLAVARWLWQIQRYLSPSWAEKRQSDKSYIPTESEKSCYMWGYAANKAQGRQRKLNDHV